MRNASLALDWLEQLEEDSDDTQDAQCLAATAGGQSGNPSTQKIMEDGVKIRVPGPQLHEADKTSCNWNMTHFGNAVSFERDIERVLKATRVERDLNTTVKEIGNPFGDRPRKTSIPCWYLKAWALMVRLPQMVYLATPRRRYSSLRNPCVLPAST
ncbi:hypothetical protein OKW46_003389 [Paraburkholderia sp. WSM4179]|nr:hypothetical protein [Paraburkholderia sp. WSM4179]